ncbi:rubredoxin [Methanocaldococcus infernus]
MAKYQCMCGWIYDEEKGLPEQGIEPGTKWEELPEDFRCPQCGLGKSAFRKLGE